MQLAPENLRYDCLRFCCQPELTAWQLAVDLAKRFNGEIINGDVVQMYDGLPIVTNKITAEEQQGIPHHLLGCIALDEETWRVDMFKKKASQIIKEIRSRGCLPIVVGGTHYYTQSLLLGDSIIDGVMGSEHESLTKYSNQEISEKFPILDGPTKVMLERLREVDPVMAERWHPQDRRKIRRSLEIYLTTGKKASDIYTEQKARKAPREIDATTSRDTLEAETDSSTPYLFWIHAESAKLKERLDNRVLKMIKNGLVEEVKSMNAFLQDQAKSDIEVDRTRGIWVSIGFKEFEPYLQALESASASQDELSGLFSLAVERTQAATRQYAKKQVRWIRLQLIPALKNDHALANLYLFDGSDIATWEETVSVPALDVATKLLSGDKVAPPEEVCAIAKDILSPENVEKPDIWFRQTCDVCNMTAVTDIQWQTHLKSRRHRGHIKKRQREAVRASQQQKSGETGSTSDTP